MPKVWGRQPGNRIVVTFNDLGQPNDIEKTSMLAHFLGTIARNGRYCPLNYNDWRVMPKIYKTEMLRLVKGKFEIPPGREPYILSSINKKWRNWKCCLKKLNFDPHVPIEEQIPETVNDEQYKALVNHWLSDNAKKKSQNNKQSRAHVAYLHCMGKKSFARVREIMKKDLGRYPTRAELFKVCFCKPDGTSEVLLEAIAQMEELAAQNPQNSNSGDIIHDLNDDFAKVMGKDKDVQLSLYGLGVRRGDVYGEKPSRASLLRQSMEYKEKYLEGLEKYDALNAKLEELTAFVLGKSRSIEQPDVESAPVAPQRGKTKYQSAPPAPLDNHIASASTSRPVEIKKFNNTATCGAAKKAKVLPSSTQSTLKVGSYVALKSVGNLNEIVATGIVIKTNNVRVNGMELDHDFCEIIIQFQVKKDARLFFTRGNFQTIGDVIGAPVVWPSSLVALEEDEN